LDTDKNALYKIYRIVQMLENWFKSSLEFALMFYYFPTLEYEEVYYENI